MVIVWGWFRGRERYGVVGSALALRMCGERWMVVGWRDGFGVLWRSVGRGGVALGFGRWWMVDRLMGWWWCRTVI